MYIELKEIDIREINPDRKTYSGKPVSIVLYKDGTSEEIPDEIYLELISETPYDASERQAKTAKVITKKILEVLLDFEAKIFDVNYILNQVEASIHDSIEKSNTKLWGKEFFNRTLLDMNKILLNEQSKTTTDSDGTKTRGSKSNKSAKNKA